SSRRRHTRSYGDWSSDVCSSDLEAMKSFHILLVSVWISAAPRCVSAADASTLSDASLVNIKFDQKINQQVSLELQFRDEEGKTRSEERRVGKECRDECGKYKKRK